MRIQICNKIGKPHLDYQRHVSEPGAELVKDGKGRWKVNVVNQVNSLQPAQSRYGSQQMASVSVDMQHPAIKSRENSLHRLASPPFKTVYGSHMKGINTLRNDAPGDPFHHVAAR